jgi:putative ABC transport system permease protein
VAEVRPIRESRVQFRGVEIVVRASAFDPPPAERDLRRFTVVEGDPRRAIAEVAAGSAVLVSQNMGARFGLRPGDTVELPTPYGSARLPIAGVVIDYLSQTGTVILSREEYRRLWQDPLVDAFGIGVVPGVSDQATRERIGERLGSRFDVVVLTIGDYLEETRALIRRAFLPFRGIEVVVLLIGLLSLLNTLLVCAAERFREFGLLRASGASTGQLVRMILLEALAISIVASLLGVAVGFYGSHSWIRVHIPVATGWIVQYAFPLASVAGAVAVALVLSVVAGAYPGRVVARMPIIDALKVE